MEKGVKRYVCSDTVLETKIDEEIVLLNLNGGLYYGLEPVGSRIWELLLEEPRTLDSLTEMLMDEFDVEEARCRQETAKFLETLVEKGLLSGQTTAE